MRAWLRQPPLKSLDEVSARSVCWAHAAAFPRDLVSTQRVDLFRAALASADVRPAMTVLVMVVVVQPVTDVSGWWIQDSLKIVVMLQAASLAQHIQSARALPVALLHAVLRCVTPDGNNAVLHAALLAAGRLFCIAHAVAYVDTVRSPLVAVY